MEFSVLATDGEEDHTVVGYNPELMYYTQQENILERVTHLYLEKLTKNIEHIFHDNSEK